MSREQPAKMARCSTRMHFVDRRTDPKNFTCQCQQVMTDNANWRGQPFTLIHTDDDIKGAIDSGMAALNDHI